MLTTGVDIIEIERVANAMARWGDRFVERVFTPDEMAACRGLPQELAARFAAKEAASKALGTGIWCADGARWRDIEVLPDRLGKPCIRLSGRARQRARRLRLGPLAVSLSHSDNLAIAFVVAQSSERGRRVR
jgi:holo-[acyl-carrier protein] synthase